jgi:hypothetical protein
VRSGPRLVAVLARRGGVERDDFVDSIRRYGDALRTGLPGHVALRIGVRHPQDPFASLMGERGDVAPVDAVIELTGPDDGDVVDLQPLVEGLAGSLADAVDPARSSVVAGTCHHVIEGTGAVMVALGGLRAPGTTMAQLGEWWLHQHAPLVLRTVQALPNSYEQLHADADASVAAATAAGVEPTRWDMFDSIYVDSLSEFVASMSDPEVAATLFEDEVGHVDHGSLRGAAQVVV